MQQDRQLFDIIEREKERQLKGIELIASENFVSEQVMQAMGSVLTNKYAEGYPGRRYYGGCEVVVERTAGNDRLENYLVQSGQTHSHTRAQAMQLSSWLA